MFVHLSSASPIQSSFIYVILLALATAVVGMSHMARDCNQGGRRCGGMHGDGGGSGSATTMGILGILQGTSKQVL
ncbi:hypothetical protein S245_013937 [Arachis hypogaea]